MARIFNIYYKLKDFDITRLKSQGYKGEKKAGDWSLAHTVRSLPAAKKQEAVMRKRMPHHEIKTEEASESYRII